MKKVMFVCCNFIWGGVEQYILNVADYIDRSKYELSVLLPENREYDRESDLINRNIRVYKLNEAPRKQKLKEFKVLLINEKIDIVHLTLGYQSFLYAKTALKTTAEKVIIHSHISKTGNENENAVYKLFKKLAFLYFNKTVCKKTINFACSEEASKYLFAKSQRAEVLWNGINIEKFKNEIVDKSFYDKYKIDSNAINILTIGRLDTPKNPLFIIKIFNELLKLNPNYRLIYIGKGPKENEVFNMEKKFGIEKKINHVSSTTEISKFMKCSNAFLLPSLYEGCPLVLIEAQASGLKCFISDNIDKLVNCGLCKTVSLEKSELEWAAVIDNEIKTNSENLKINNDILNKFSIKSTVKRLEEIYG